MYLPLDGPAAPAVLNIDDVTPVEVKASSNALGERKVVTIQPFTGPIYVYFADDSGSAPSAATVAAQGFLHFNKAKETYEAGEDQKLYILAVSGSVAVRIAERA